MTKQPVYWPICKELGYKDMPAHRLSYNPKTGMVKFQCNWHPDHKFELPLEEIKGKGCIGESI